MTVPRRVPQRSGGLLRGPWGDGGPSPAAIWLHVDDFLVGSLPVATLGVDGNEVDDALAVRVFPDEIAHEDDPLARTIPDFPEFEVRRRDQHAA